MKTLPLEMRDQAACTLRRVETLCGLLLACDQHLPQDEPLETALVAETAAMIKAEAGALRRLLGLPLPG